MTSDIDWLAYVCSFDYALIKLYRKIIIFVSSCSVIFVHTNPTLKNITLLAIPLFPPF